jgi:hypothetical protein
MMLITLGHLTPNGNGILRDNEGAKAPGKKLMSNPRLSSCGLMILAEPGFSPLEKIVLRARIFCTFMLLFTNGNGQSGS